jgi:hypothetical protein
MRLHGLIWLGQGKLFFECFTEQELKAEKQGFVDGKSCQKENKERGSELM